MRERIQYNATVWTREKVGLAALYSMLRENAAASSIDLVVASLLLGSFQIFGGRTGGVQTHDHSHDRSDESSARIGQSTFYLTGLILMILFHDELF